MAGQDRAARDKAMAAHLKARGVVRTTMRCPLCHHVVGVDGGLKTHMGKAGCRRAKGPGTS